MTTKTLKLDQIRLDGGTQIRVEINDDAVAEYAEARKDGAVLPPVVVFFDGSDYWLADGFHRFHSAKRNKAKSMRAEVRPGDRREAILCAVGSNTDHGLRRTNADKRNAVETLLKDEDWAKKSDRWISDAAYVSHTFVATVREQLATLPVDNGDGATDNGDPGTRTGQDGKTRRRRKKTTKKATRKASPQEGADDVDEVNDGLGNPVTDEKLRPAFKIATELGRKMRQVASIRTFLKETVIGSDVGSQIDAGDLRQWDRKLEALHDFLKFARPHAACIHCKGNDKKCRACKGVGWLNEIKYKVPTETGK